LPGSPFLLPYRVPVRSDFGSLLSKSSCSSHPPYNLPNSTNSTLVETPPKGTSKWTSEVEIRLIIAKAIECIFEQDCFP
jgi:hypothetical protein